MVKMKTVDPPVQVRIVDDPEAWSIWHISQNLTDRWGEINDTDAGNKPLEALTSTPGLLERLRAQLWGDICFVVRKDGKFGIGRLRGLASHPAAL